MLGGGAHEIEGPLNQQKNEALAVECYCGGGWTGCCFSCFSCLSLPPPKIFWKMFFFFFCSGCWLVSGALPSGGVLGAVRTMGAPVAAGGAVASGVADLLPPIPK